MPRRLVVRPAREISDHVSSPSASEKIIHVTVLKTVLLRRYFVTRDTIDYRF